MTSAGCDDAAVWVESVDAEPASVVPSLQPSSELSSLQPSPDSPSLQPSSELSSPRRVGRLRRRRDVVRQRRIVAADELDVEPGPRREEERDGDRGDAHAQVVDALRARLALGGGDCCGSRLSGMSGSVLRGCESTLSAV